MTILLMIATGFMLLLFLFSVAVQWNDPDPIRWMAIYGAAAVGCILNLLGRNYAWYYGIVCVAGLIWAALLANKVIGKVRFGELFEEFEMKDHRVEVAREFGGLLIVAFWMGLLLVITIMQGKQTL